ncbi:hypothetical protein RHMOL_Rhmol04G0133100 [Rhododendron molle]|uniref:Uncharacterized protein n=1 Tax=Rhododendron molle TaxID=49168 RepID=A0ACC0P119_RHOML|nr:hypothetical protein RHMOL_Rhmol04G0133100 [Rhododendron molle]
MPHYHAVEATKAIRPILGDYYKFDGTPFVKAIWRDFKECVYVEADDGGQKESYSRRLERIGSTGLRKEVKPSMGLTLAELESSRMPGNLMGDDKGIDDQSPSERQP